MAYLIKYRKKWDSKIETEKAADSKDLERLITEIGKTVHKSIVRARECV